MNKRFISFILSLCVLTSMIVALPMKASAASYSVNNAIAYAQSHWNDGKGLCAEFVSDCVMAGGVNTGTIKTVRALWPKICSLTGLSKIDLKLDGKGYATKALNGNILGRGDVVVQWCYTHNIGPHIMLCGGYDSSGYATYYAHNGAMNNQRYKLSVNLAYEHTEACNMGAQVIRLSTIDNGQPSTYVPPKKATFSPATEADYVAKQAISETNATVVNQVNKQYGVKVTQMGIYLYDANGNLIKRHIENISNVPATQTKYHSWYDIQKELGITLTPGTTYKYRIFGIFDGEEVVADALSSFTTLGPTPTPVPTPTPTPVPTLTPTPVSDKITVYFDANGGHSIITSVQLIPGSNIVQLPVPDRKGYEFDGWYTDENHGSKHVTSTTKINVGYDITLYAKWTKTEEENEIPETITVYFDAQGGKCSPKSVKVVPGETISNIPVPTRSGYKFEGWYSDESLGSKKIGTNTKMNLTYDVTLYAKWSEEDFEMLGEEYFFPFEDVKTSDWYHNDVKNAHKMGLINGKSEKKYGANENMTYAEAIKLAACMHQLYEKGEVTLTNSSGNWYQSYVDYARENGIPWSCKNYNAQINRRDYVYIFYYALPEEAYEEINYIDEIPDVKHSDKFSDEIYAFYRAGILSGSDSKGTFNPQSSIKRSEVAAILSRMMDEGARKEFSLY